MSYLDFAAKFIVPSIEILAVVVPAYVNSST